MRKILAVLLTAGMATVFTAGTADAIKLAGMKAVGWNDRNAPIGGAYWFTDRVGIQAGLGFNKFDDGDDNDDNDPETAFAFTVAVPIYLAGPEDCHFLFRPGLFYETDPSPGVDNFLSVRADLAVEYFLSHHFSIVGGHGIEYISESPAVGDSQTAIQSRALSLSTVGFYYYFGS
jgi:hypothetical protein